MAVSSQDILRSLNFSECIWRYLVHKSIEFDHYRGLYGFCKIDAQSVATRKGSGVHSSQYIHVNCSL